MDVLDAKKFRILVRCSKNSIFSLFKVRTNMSESVHLSTLWLKYLINGRQNAQKFQKPSEFQGLCLILPILMVGMVGKVGSELRPCLKSKTPPPKFQILNIPTHSILLIQITIPPTTRMHKTPIILIPLNRTVTTPGPAQRPNIVIIQITGHQIKIRVRL